MRYAKARTHYWLQIGRVEFWWWRDEHVRIWSIQRCTNLTVFDMGPLTIDIYKRRRNLA